MFSSEDSNLCYKSLVNNITKWTEMCVILNVGLSAIITIMLSSADQNRVIFSYRYQSDKNVALFSRLFSIGNQPMYLVNNNHAIFIRIAFMLNIFSK